jgi:hypothetical protein
MNSNILTLTQGQFASVNYFSGSLFSTHLLAFFQALNRARATLRGSRENMLATVSLRSNARLCVSEWNR